MLPDLSKCDWNTGVPNDTGSINWVDVAKERVELHKTSDDETKDLVFYNFVEQVGGLVNRGAIEHSKFTTMLIKFKGLGVEPTKKLMEMVREKGWGKTFDQLAEFFGGAGAVGLGLTAKVWQTSLRRQRIMKLCDCKDVKHTKA